MIDAITKQFVTRLSDAGVTGDPCDEWEIRDLEQQLRVALPPAFKAFMLLAGKYFDPFVGSQYVLGHDGGDLEMDPAEVQQRACNIFRCDGQKPPSNAFMFFVHHGTAARYFLLDDGDDPAVYEYVEQRPPPKQVPASFSTFLAEEVRLLNELRSARGAAR